MGLKWKPPRLPEKKVARFSNTAPYALYVHEGATLKSGTRLPSRPWLRDTVAGDHGFGADEFLAINVFAEEYRKTPSFAKAFKATARAANKEVIAAFNYSWAWPRITIRKSGEEAGFKRNIVDLGFLKRSQQPVRFL